jgi:hypothetical protein
LRAAFDEKCVAPAGVERVVEEYEDSRKLIKNRYNGSIIPVDALRYMCESELSYDPIN